VATWNSDLIPDDVVSDVIESAAAGSVVLRLARTVSMPAGVMSIPVVSVVPWPAWRP
jgi:hypothetical protein